MGFLSFAIFACSDHTPHVNASAQREYREAQASEPLAYLTRGGAEASAKDRLEGDRGETRDTGAPEPEDETPEPPPQPTSVETPTGEGKLLESTRNLASNDEIASRVSEHPSAASLLNPGEARPVIFLKQEAEEGKNDYGYFKRTDGEADLTVLGEKEAEARFKYSCDPQGVCFKMAEAVAEPSRELQISVTWNQDRIPWSAYRIGKMSGNADDSVFAAIWFNDRYKAPETPPAWVNEDPPSDWRAYLFEPKFAALKEPYEATMKLSRIKDGHELTLNRTEGEPWISIDLKREASHPWQDITPQGGKQMAIFASEKGAPPAFSGVVRTRDGAETWFIAVPDDGKMRMELSAGILP